MSAADRDRLQKRVDPSQTKTLRETWMRQARARFTELKGVIRETVDANDGFGLRDSTRVPMLQRKYFEDPPGPGGFSFPRDPDKISAFMAWLREQERRGILVIVENPAAGMAGDTSRWQNIYIRQAYAKGVNHADATLNAQGVMVPDDELRQIFARPMHAETVGGMYIRAFNELEGVTNRMDQQISRVLADGLAQGNNPRVIAGNMASVVDGIGISRAETIARTETIRTFNEAALTRFQEFGIDEVAAKVEFLTAGDDRVCVECQALEGEVFKTDEARGVLPLHPGCRCVWLPVVPTERRNVVVFTNARRTRSAVAPPA